MLSDEEIVSMTRQERRRVIDKLIHLPGQEPLPIRHVRWRRRSRLAVMTVCAVGMVPWTIYLVATLPRHYVVHDWSLTWAGFDVILTAMFVLTAVLGLLRRHAVVLAAFTSGVLLLCDAWFDVTTANAQDLPLSVASALVLEIPIALLLVTGAANLVRIQLLESDLLDPRDRLWRAPLTLPAGVAERPPRCRRGIRHFRASAR